MVRRRMLFVLRSMHFVAKYGFLNENCMTHKLSNVIGCIMNFIVGIIFKWILFGSYEEK